MAWSAPMTAVANTAFTAAQFNQYVRDNLNETAAAKASEVSSLFVGDGSNSLVERVPGKHIVSAEESTSSTSYTNLATVGPRVTVNCGSRAIVMFSARMWCETANRSCLVSVEISGANTVAADDDRSIWYDNGHNGNNTDQQRHGTATMFDGLTPGENTFTMKYRGGTSPTSHYGARELIVIPL